MKKISFLVLLACGMLHAQQDVKVEEQIRSIYSTALLNGQSYPWLEHLSNQIGGRLSGSLNASKTIPSKTNPNPRHCCTSLEGIADFRNTQSDEAFANTFLEETKKTIQWIKNSRNATVE